MKISKSKALKDQFVGEIKKSVGKATCNPSLQIKGEVQKTRGNAKMKMAKTKGYGRGVKHNAHGGMKQSKGQLSGNKLKMKGNFLKKLNS